MGTVPHKVLQVGLLLWRPRKAALRSEPCTYRLTVTAVLAVLLMPPNPEIATPSDVFLILRLDPEPYHVSRTFNPVISSFFLFHVRF